jgi:hypothetical protein
MKISAQLQTHTHANLANEHGETDDNKHHERNRENDDEKVLAKSVTGRRFALVRVVLRELVQMTLFVVHKTGKQAKMHFSLS